MSGIENDEKVVKARQSMEKTLRTSGYPKETLEACEAGGWKIKSFSKGDEKLSYQLVIYRDKVARYHFALEDFHAKEQLMFSSSDDSRDHSPRAQLLIDELEMNLEQYRERDRIAHEKEKILVAANEQITEENQQMKKDAAMSMKVIQQSTGDLMKMRTQFDLLKADHSYCGERENFAVSKIKEYDRLKQVEKKMEAIEEIVRTPVVESELSVAEEQKLCKGCLKMKSRSEYLVSQWITNSRKCNVCRNNINFSRHERRRNRRKQVQNQKQASRSFRKKKSVEVLRTKVELKEGNLIGVAPVSRLTRQAISHHQTLGNLSPGGNLVIAMINFEWEGQFESRVRPKKRHDCGGEFLCQYCQHVDRYGTPLESPREDQAEFRLLEFACVLLNRSGEISKVNNYVVSNGDGKEIDRQNEVRKKYTYSDTDLIGVESLPKYFEELEKTIDAYIAFNGKRILKVFKKIGVSFNCPMLDCQLLSNLLPCSNGRKLSLQIVSDYCGHKTEYSRVAGNDALIASFIYETIVQEFPFYCGNLK